MVRSGSFVLTLCQWRTFQKGVEVFDWECYMKTNIGLARLMSRPSIIKYAKWKYIFISFQYGMLFQVSDLYNVKVSDFKCFGYIHVGLKQYSSLTISNTVNHNVKLQCISYRVQWSKQFQWQNFSYIWSKWN